MKRSVRLMTLHVCVQCFLGFKSVSALVAHKRPFVAVRFHVCVQYILELKSVIALVAHKRPFVAMLFHVPIELECSGKLLLTFFTLNISSFQMYKFDMVI